jgi:hypothetical protein
MAHQGKHINHNSQYVSIIGREDFECTHHREKTLFYDDRYANYPELVSIQCL